MIEMRWVVCDMRDGRCLDGTALVCESDRNYVANKLQYRYREQNYLLADISDWQWSHWIDVKPPIKDVT